MRRWVYVGLLFLAVAINYLDRATLSVAAPVLEKEFDITPAIMGLIMSAFFWTYLVMQIPAGRLIDRFGPKRIYGVAATIWSGATIAGATATGPLGMIFARMALGVGESFCYPLNAKVTTRWFGSGERGLATGLWASGARVGSALSLPLVALLISSHGWRIAFVIAGIIGFIWLGVWWFVYHDPLEKAARSEAFPNASPASPMETTPIPAAPKIAWHQLLRQRTVIGMMVGFFCLNFNIYFFTTWFPSYLVNAYGLSLKEMGMLGLIPGLVAIPAGWLGGLATDALQRTGLGLSKARKICLVGGFLTSSVIALTPLFPSVATAITLLSISYSALAFTGAVIWMLPGDVAPSPDQVGSLAGIQNMASNLAGILLTTFTGLMLTITSGSFLIPLTVAGAFCLLGACAYLFIIGPIQPLRNPSGQAVDA